MADGGGYYVYVKGCMEGCTYIKEEEGANSILARGRCWCWNILKTGSETGEGGVN